MLKARKAQATVVNISFLRHVPLTEWPISQDDLLVCLWQLHGEATDWIVGDWSSYLKDVMR